MKQIFFLSFILLTSLMSGSQPIGYDVQPPLSRYLDHIHQQTRFSGEILVAQGNEVIFNHAIGHASVENNVLMTVDAKYRIASLSKSFTACLIANAVSERRLDFTDKVGTYVSGLSPDFSEITIHQLLTHTSGLPHNEGIEDYWMVKSKLHLTRTQILNEINRVKLQFMPGSDRQYSSPGYYLLAVVLEELYGKDYDKILREKILQPLKLTGSGSGDLFAITPRMTCGYHLIKDDSIVVAPFRSYAMLKGAGDMFSTARDLLSWNIAFFDSLVSMEPFSKMISAHPPITKENKTFGYGWFLRDGLHPRVFHGGGTWGYSAINLYYPKEKISIIVLSNVSALPVESIADDIEAILFGSNKEYFDESLPAKGDHDLSVYAGQFESDSGKGHLTVRLEGSGLYMQLAGNPPFQIYHKDGRRFIGKRIEIEIDFEIMDGTVIGLTARRLGQTFHFKKV